MLGHLHQNLVYSRRTRVLAEAFAGELPRDARVLDVGCGDGLISSMIARLRPDTSIIGIDVLLRPSRHIDVAEFDGTHIPFEDRSFDAVLFIDVLHHTDDPMILLREAARVARGCIIIKDHTRNGFLAGPTLHFMDWIGNARHGVRIPANYWTEAQWRAAFRDLRLDIPRWTGEVALYPAWASWLFGRSLHFIATLAPANARSTPPDPAP